MSETITQERLLDLPAPIQRYLVYTGVVGMPWIKKVRLKYGKFRQAADKPWMPMSAAESYTTDPASFLLGCQIQGRGDSASTRHRKIRKWQRFHAW